MATTYTPGAADLAAGTVTLTLTANPIAPCVAAQDSLVLTINAPTITQQPLPQTVCAGDAAMFSVAASGAAPLSFQWQLDMIDLVDGGDISGATTNMLTIINVDAADVGNYRCVVTDANNCTATSNEAALALDTTDTDMDGTPDCIDGCPMDPDKIDPGICGCGVPDTDTDGDGVPDCNDICPGFDDNLDADGDGTPDGCDGCPNDPNKTAPGVCGCGVPDVDSDGDGVLDCNDVCPGFDDNLDADLDGVPDGCDVCPGFDDTLDADGDGTPDGCDGCPNDPNKTAPGVCGCGVPDVDSDGDGVLDCNDVCPGFDDNLDADLDGVPDGCDPCPLGAGGGDGCRSAPCGECVSGWNSHRRVLPRTEDRVD